MSAMSFFRLWLSDHRGIAAAEAALVFPIMLTMLLGTFDVGRAILVNQKTIRASQVVADLVTRVMVVSDLDLDEAINAGGLSFQPYSDEAYGIDVVSLRFDEDGDPEILWRETRNMEPIEDVLERVEALSDPNTGVVVVSAQYVFEPVFAGFVMDSLPMKEIAFAKGRRSSLVCRSGVDC